MAERQSSDTIAGKQDLEDELMELLPVNISSADVEKYPEFMKLLKALSRHITDKGLSVSAQQDISEAQEYLKVCKGKWLQCHIPYLELQDLLMDHQLRLVESTPCSNTQFYKTVKECLALAEIGDCLQCNPDPCSEATLLGLTQEDIHRNHPHKKRLSSIQQKLIPEMEARLRRKCERLLTFHDSPNTDPESQDHTFVKCSQLPGILEMEKHSIKEEERLLKKDRAIREKYFWQYYQTLMDVLAALETLITTYRLRSQSDNDVITSEWLCAKCDALYLKINQMELQLLCDTYYAETVQALMVIRRKLDSTMSNTQEEWTKASEALKTYQCVGMGFDSLVQEFTQLRDEIENKKWALRELKVSLNGGNICT
ncbi:hypothetical protein LSAT2_017971 [Lamellibrachia satsuma]|nr:hypothetical protein LSAT2_017971 [Lamellibrachia satsuma]